MKAYIPKPLEIKKVAVSRFSETGQPEKLIVNGEVVARFDIPSSIGLRGGKLADRIGESLYACREINPAAVPGLLVALKETRDAAAMLCQVIHDTGNWHLINDPRLLPYDGFGARADAAIAKAKETQE